MTENSSMSGVLSGLPGGVLAPKWVTLRASGPDAASWLQAILTCHVTKLTAGAATWGVMLSKQGKILAELQLSGGGEEILIGVSGGDEQTLLAELNRYLIMEDAEIAEVAGVDWFVCIGDRAVERANEALGEKGELLDISPLPWLGALSSVDGFSSVASGGALVMVRGSDSTTAREAGARLSAEFGTLTNEEWDALRPEIGVPRYGVDYGEADNVHEASIEHRVIAWQKGCYLGQEVVCMQDMRGKVKRRLVGLRAAGVEAESGDSPMAGGEINGGAELALANGQVVGEVTTAGRWRCIARVTAEGYEPGTKLTIAGGLPLVVEPLLPG